MKKVLIVEDNKLEAEALTKAVRKVDSNTQVMTTDNLGIAFQYAVQQNIALFIVDIVLNPRMKTDMSGLEFVETIRKLPQYKYVPVVFVTGLNDPKLYAYEGLHCYQYLQKPLLYSEVETIIRESFEFPRMLEDKSPLKIKQDGILYIIPKQDIIYAFSKGSKMTIVTIKDRYQFFYWTCNMLLDKLQTDYFVKCNRNTIVNNRYIVSINQRAHLIELEGCMDKIKIGKNYRKDFLKELYETDGDFL